MAIARGAGTEIIRNILMEDVNNTNRVLIFGVQHHIYTVLSIICHCDVVNAAGDYIRTYITGYDSLGGTTDERFYIFKQDMQVGQTYVWNDKFSFNGAEPANFTGPMDDATKQDAIADQGSTPVAQRLDIGAEHSSDAFDICCTYIDQNNA
jgi:hypothetical protein